MEMALNSFAGASACMIMNVPNKMIQGPLILASSGISCSLLIKCIPNAIQYMVSVRDGFLPDIEQRYLM
jgi:hypothetical protein